MTDEQKSTSNQPQPSQQPSNQQGQQPSNQQGQQQPYQQGQQQPYQQGQQQPYQQGQQQEPSKKSKKGCLIGCLVVLGLVVIIGLVAGLVLPRILGSYLTRMGGEELARLIPGFIEGIDSSSTTAPRRTTSAAGQETTRSTTTSTREPVTEDASGEDIEDLPRYPGSIRTDSAKFQYGRTFQQSAEYLSRDDIDDIKEFYEDYLRRTDWQQVMSMTINNELGMSYQRKGDKVEEIITITAKASRRHEDQVEIMLIYHRQTSE